MANINALAAGLWSAPGTWTGGVPPGPGDNVYANNKAITIDQSITVASLNTGLLAGGAAGGSFTLSAGFTVTANIVPGTTNCLVCSAGGATFTVIGNVVGSPSTNNIHGIAFSGISSVLNVTGSVSGSAGGTGCSGIAQTGVSSTVNINGTVSGGTASRGMVISGNADITNITGDVTGGSGGSAYGFEAGAANGVLTVTGNVLAGSAGPGFIMSTSHAITINGNVSGAAVGTGNGLNHNGTGALIINGDVTGGATSGHGIQMTTSTGSVTVNGDVIAYTGGTINGAIYIDRVVTLTINGNVIGGTTGVNKYAIYMLASGATVVTVNGDVTAGVGATFPAIYQNSSGTSATVRVNGTITASTTYTAIWVVPTTVTVATTGPLVSANNGMTPVVSYIMKLRATTAAENYFDIWDEVNSTMARLSSHDFATDLPIEADVRDGVVFGGSDVGTLKVPLPSQVSAGIDTDGTVGTAALLPSDVWDFLRSAATTSGSMGERLKDAATVDTTGDQIATLT